MKKTVISSFGVCLFFSIISIFAQTAERPVISLSAQGNKDQPNQERRNTNAPRTDRRSSSAASQNFFPFKAKRDKEQENRLKPNPQDLNRYADFLKQSKTGIFRLFNDLDCESNVYVIRVDDACQNTVPGGAFYSFREKEYTTAFLADIRFKQGLLISDGLLSQNMLVKLGDVQLESLNLESEGVKFLTEFVPEKVNTTATKQFIEIVKGIKIGRHEYRKVLPAAENTTYAIRTIAYRGSVYRRFGGWFFNLLEGDKRVDMIVAFRVIRKDADGNVTLLWKELDRKKSPKMEYEKKKKTPPKSAPNISDREVVGN